MKPRLELKKYHGASLIHRDKKELAELGEQQFKAAQAILENGVANFNNSKYDSDFIKAFQIHYKKIKKSGLSIMVSKFPYLLNCRVFCMEQKGN